VPDPWIERRKQELAKMIERYDRVAEGYEKMGKTQLAKTYRDRASVARVELASYDTTNGGRV